MIEFIISNAFLFFFWTFFIWWFHYMAHHVPWMWKLHQSHHNEVTWGETNGNNWNWKTIFLFLDSWTTTLDFAIIEYFPTIMFCLIFNCWWIAIFYYIWTGFIQEIIRHNEKFDWMPFLTSGRYHLEHHLDPTVNYGLFTWFWDWLLGTYKYDSRKRLA